jgi:hypothetical protein
MANVYANDNWEKTHIKIQVYQSIFMKNFPKNSGMLIKK